MEGVEGPEAGGAVEGAVFIRDFEEEVAPVGVFVAGYEAED